MPTHLPVCWVPGHKELRVPCSSCKLEISWTLAMLPGGSTSLWGKTLNSPELQGCEAHYFPVVSLGVKAKGGNFCFFLPLVLGSMYSSFLDTAPYRGHWFKMSSATWRRMLYPCKESSLNWCFSCAFSRPFLHTQDGSFRVMWHLT